MKSVLITGTSKGIGFETALSFARGGYKVFATMRNLEAASTLQKQITDESLNVIIYKKGREKNWKHNLISIKF
jgi:NAD(P)-dependent dehydrogenase (short-subunit alcohol dehydrogenase family)